MRVTDEQLAVFEQSVQIDGNRLVITRQLPRDEYLSVNKILVALGGKWGGREKAHLFPADPTPLIEQAMLTREVTVARDELGFFPTPGPLADRLAAWVLEGIGDRRGFGPHFILEPSAGDGALVKATRAAGASGRVLVTAVDVDHRRLQALRDAGAHYAIASDFLSLTTSDIGPLFDGVVMNPPFGNQKEIDHVRHAWGFLAFGARLAAIMPSSVAFRTNAKTVEFRQFVEDWGGTIEPLPEGSFKPSGTSVNTVLVKIER